VRQTQQNAHRKPPSGDCHNPARRQACSRCREPFHNRRTCDVAVWKPEPPAVLVPLTPAELEDLQVGRAA